MGDSEEIVIERPVPGKAHRENVLLAIQLHQDDITLYAGGTVAKVMGEGYTGYSLRTEDETNSDYERNRVNNAKSAHHKK